MSMCVRAGVCVCVCMWVGVHAYVYAHAHNSAYKLCYQSLHAARTISHTCSNLCTAVPVIEHFLPCIALRLLVTYIALLASTCRDRLLVIQHRTRDRKAVSYTHLTLPTNAEV